MQVTTELITPKKAEQYLNCNHGNRKLREGVVEKYASDMVEQRWTQCLAPISFYENGDIADGQHRLWAVVESNTSQNFLVVRNVTREAGLNIDTGLGRTLVDNAKISGLDPTLSTELLSYARAIAKGERNTGTRSNAVVLAEVEQYREAAQWAVTNGPRGRGLRNAVVMGALGRAWYHEQDKMKLKRYCEVFATGFADGNHESAAIAMRNYVLSHGSQLLTAAEWRASFLKAQNSIRYFMLGHPLKTIKVIAEETYPLNKKVRNVSKVTQNIKNTEKRATR